MRTLSLAAIFLAAMASVNVRGDSLQDCLDRGQARQALEAMSTNLALHPEDDNVRFETAVAEVIAGTEALGQKWYRYGLHSRLEEMAPFLRLPIPGNPKPDAITYEQFRQALLDFQKSLDQTAKTLSAIPDSSAMKVPLDVQAIKLRIIPGNGAEASGLVSLWSVFSSLGRDPQPTITNGMIHFDVGDARWLEGYCHLLSALIDAQAAYDGRDLFNHTAHLFFARPVTPFPYLRGTNQEAYSFENIVDAITLVHLLNLKLEDPQRMLSAREHLLSVISLSRRSWKDIDAETDDDHEWIPNPRQEGALGKTRISPEMLASWNEFLDESEKLLRGQKLVPFWRPVPDLGVNIEKVFTQPTNFDLVLWVQGTAAAPYLQEGPITDTKFWASLNVVFHGDFLLFAVWFN